MTVIVINSKDIKNNLKDIDLPLETKRYIFPILREKYAYKNNTEDYIRVISFNLFGVSLNIIRYVDYNKYDWKLNNLESLSGNFSNTKPMVIKIANGFVINIHRYVGKRTFLKSSKSTSLARNYYMFDDEMSYNIYEICDNICHYEYLKDIKVKFDTDKLEFTEDDE